MRIVKVTIAIAAAISMFLFLPRSTLADRPFNPGGRTGNFTGCVSEDLTLAEIRELCIDQFLPYWNYELEDTILTVTHCPSDIVPPSNSQGKKATWTINGQCSLPNLFCTEGQVKINCAFKAKPNAEPIEQ